MKTCATEGCTSPHYHAGLCLSHYSARRVQKQIDRGELCDYCGEEPYGTLALVKGLCNRCYHQEFRYAPIAGSQVERYLKAPGGLTAAAFLAKIFPNGDAAKALKEASHA